MKNFYFLSMAAASLLSFSNINVCFASETDNIVLDLNSPTNPETFVFSENGSWVETFTESEYEYIESQIFGFAHLTSGPNYGGSYWDGFTVSKSTDNDINHDDFINRQWGSMAQGGVDGIGTPFLLGYFQEYTGKRCNQVIFTDGNKYAPTGCYVNNSPWTTNNILIDGQYTTPFSQGSYLTLTATALDENYEETGVTATYYLADYRSENKEEWTLNSEWEWFDLSSLGNCYGFNLSMYTTDRGMYGANTALFFCMDKLTVTTPISSSIEESRQQSVSVYPARFANVINIRVAQSTPVIIADLQGKTVFSSVVAEGTTTVDASSFHNGVYVVKAGNETFKIVK